MRRWACVTAILAIFYGFAFLVHERPPTGGHALAGLGILGLSIFLLATIAVLSNQQSRTNATWLLVCQALTSAAASAALLLQQVPLTAKFMGVFIFAAPLMMSSRHFRPETWTPKPITYRTVVTDLVVEVLLVVGAIALMIWLRNPGLILFAISGCVGITQTVYVLRSFRHLDGTFPDQLSA